MVGKKFAEKASAIRFDLPPAVPAASPEAAAASTRPRTAMGSHVDALYRDRALAEETERLKGILKDHEGSFPTRLLDPADIVLSKFANRHPDSYKDREFMELRAEIKAAGGNKQPIGVRPLAGSPGKYELSFGSRRRQACLEEGLQVLAMIEDMDDVGLFERMERENRQRKNLRPYEQGVLYQRALDENIYPSAKKMAADLQIDAGGLGRLLSIAKLPMAVLEAFPSPLDIQYLWGPLLNEALQRNPDAVLAAAESVRARGEKRSAKAVLDELTAAAVAEKGAKAWADDVVISGGNNQTARLKFSRNAISIKMKNVPTDRRRQLEALLTEFLK